MENQDPSSQTPSLNPEPKKSWFSAHHVLGYVFLFAVLASIVSGVYYWQTVSQIPPQDEFPVHKDELAGWKTYTNTEYGFEFKYPKTWLLDSNAVNQSGPDEFFDIHLTNYNIGDSRPDCTKFVGMEIQAVLAFEGSFDSFVKSQAAIGGLGMPSGTLTKMSVDGHDAYQAEQSGWDGGCGGPGYLIQVNNNRYIYIFSGRGQVSDQKLIDQILSTFKFTDSSSSVDTSTWKTYTNDQYGFEIKYPPDGQVVDSSIFPNAKELIPQSAIALDIPDLGTTVGMGSLCWKQITIGGKVGEYCDFSSQVGGPYRVIVVPLYIDSKTPSLSKELKITVPIINNQIYDQILSTFKFTK